MADVGQWYNSLPRFTRYWLTATIVISLFGRFDIPSIFKMNLSWNYVWNHLEIWRLFTSLFVYPLTRNTMFHYIMNCYFIVQYGSRLEKDQFGRSPADYCYLLIFVVLFSILAGLFFGTWFLMDMLIAAVTYIWCQFNKEVTINFWFGIKIKAVYLPWVLVVIDVIFNNSLDTIIGIFIGHLYYFLKFQYPQELGGNQFLETPSFLKRWLPDVSGGFGGFGVYSIPPATRTPTAGTTGAGAALRNPWGRGNTLGAN